MTSIMDIVCNYVNEYNNARNSGNVARAVDMGTRAVRVAKEELAKPDLNLAHKGYYENVVRTVSEFLKDPAACAPKAKATKGADSGEDDEISATDWFAAPVPKLKLKDIAGLQNVKDEFIVNVFAPMLPGYSEIYRKYKGDERGLQVLLYGPPGTGKTHAVRCLAGELGCKIAVVKVADTNRKYVGEGAKVIETVFAQAANYEKSIIFFDEIDSIASSREDEDSRHTKEQLTTLLTLMDGFTSGVKDGQIRIVIAATNRPWALDSAVKRGGRFDTQIYIPLPDYEARRQIVRLALGKDERVEKRVDVPCAPDVSVETLAERFEGYSGADIKAVCRQAINLPLEREIRAYSQKKPHADCLTMKDLECVLGRYINSITDDSLMQFDAYRQNMEYDMEYILRKLDEFIIILYNKIERGQEVELKYYELSWFRSFYESGFVRNNFKERYDLSFLDKIFRQ